MPRTRRVVEVGVPHHITQRGNNRQDIFLTPQDRQVYLRHPRSECNRYGLRVLGYCLMTNHVHLVVIPEQQDSLARAVGRTHFLYALDFNRRYKRSGHVWGERFYSCPLGRDHLVPALAYVDLNPVRGGLVKEAVAYPWSSARDHAAGCDTGGMLAMDAWREICSAGDWADVLRRPDYQVTARFGALRSATRRGVRLGKVAPGQRDRHPSAPSRDWASRF